MAQGTAIHWTYGPYMGTMDRLKNEASMIFDLWSEVQPYKGPTGQTPTVLEIPKNIAHYNFEQLPCQDKQEISFSETYTPELPFHLCFSSL